MPEKQKYIFIKQCLILVQPFNPDLSLGYPSSVSWQHFQAPHTQTMGLHFRPARVALPQIRVETLIGSQANYEIKKLIIYFYKIMISYEKYSTLNLYQHKSK